MSKMIELAHIRNQLASKRFSDADSEVLAGIKKNIVEDSSLFKYLALEAIKNCEECIQKGDYDLAAQEIQLIHNFTFDDVKMWNADHFYKIELLSYLDNVNDVLKIKKLISLLADLQNKLDEKK